MKRGNVNAVDSATCNNWPQTTGSSTTVPPVIVTPEDANNWVGPQPGPNMPIQDVIKSLINFLASRYVCSFTYRNIFTEFTQQLFS